MPDTQPAVGNRVLLLRAPIVHNIQLLESMGYFVVRVSVHDYLGLPLAPVK